MRKLIIGSAAALGAIAAPAQAQSLGSIISSVIGGGYSYGYQPYAYQPYSYQPYGYQPYYGYQRSYTYVPSYNPYGYSDYRYRSYRYSRDYDRGRHERGRWRHERDRDDNRD